MTAVVFCYGYTSFAPWDVSSFFTYYTMLLVAPILFIGWKIIHRTKLVRSHETDLVWERPIVDAYETSFYSEPLGFWREMFQLVGIGRQKADRRRSSVASY